MARADRYRFEWTGHRFTCTCCGQASLVAQDLLDRALAAARSSLEAEPDLDGALAGFTCCISCIAGLEVPGEHVDAAARAA